jgi:hypothetical protein
MIKLVGIVTFIVAFANPLAGSKWETATQTDGILFTPDGHAMFYNEWHHCPTLWATYAVQDGITIVVTGMYHHEHRILSLDANGLLHDGKSVYHRVDDITFRPPSGTSIDC